MLMTRNISNRPASDHPSTIGDVLLAKAGSKRDFGRLLDQLMAKTRKPRRRRRR